MSRRFRDEASTSAPATVKRSTFLIVLIILIVLVIILAITTFIAWDRYQKTLANLNNTIAASCPDTF